MDADDTVRGTSTTRVPRGLLWLCTGLALGCQAHPGKRAVPDGNATVAAQRDALAAQDAGTQGTPEDRGPYGALAGAILDLNHHWAPIFALEMPDEGALWMLVASAPKDAPGPRLSLLRFRATGPDGRLEPAAEPEHLMVLSQPTLDHRARLQEFHRKAAAPTHRLRRAVTVTDARAHGSANEALGALQEVARQIVDPRVAPTTRLAGLARIVDALSRELALSPSHLRAIVQTLSDVDAVRVEPHGTRRATVHMPGATWTLLKQSRWTISTIARDRDQPPR